MGWGVELWDKEKEIQGFVSEGISFIDKARTFVLEMSKLEAFMGQQIKKLTKQYFPTSADDVYSQDHAYRVYMHCL